MSFKYVKVHNIVIYLIICIALLQEINLVQAQTNNNTATGNAITDTSLCK